MNNCPNCGKEIGSAQTTCPYCSFPLPEWEKIRKVNEQTEKLPEQEEQKPVKKKAIKEEKFTVPTIKEPVRPKKKKRFLVVFLMLIILALSGFIIYEQFFDKKVKVKVKTETREDVKLITEYLLTEQEALGVGNYLYTYALDTVWCNNFKYSEEETDLGNGLKGFEITNYNDVSKYFTKDFTYEYQEKELKFNDIFDNHTLNDKYYDINKCNKEKDLTYGKTTLKIKSNEIKSIKYTVTSNYCADLKQDEECNEKTTTKTVDKEFEIVKEDNIWKIKNFVVPN